MNDADYIRLALRLARRALGETSPNPLVGAALVKNGRIIGRGWHRRAGQPHAEIEALRDAARHRRSPRGATLYVTLEPCCTHGRTPPCTDAIIAAGIRRVITGATDPNPNHAGKGLLILKRAGLQVVQGILASECEHLNEAYNHWIVHRSPFVTVKSAMTLDGKIATATGESKWITSEMSRAWAMKLRRSADAIVVGVNTVLADNPSLTARPLQGKARRVAGSMLHAQRPTLNAQPSMSSGRIQGPRRIILDSMARTPLTAKIVSDDYARLTTIVVGRHAPKRRTTALAKRVNVLIAPPARSHTQISKLKSRNSKQIDLPWLLKTLGRQNVTSLLVEGGGEVNASFLFDGLAHRVAFFYAPKILGGRNSKPAVGGGGARSLTELLHLKDLRWRHLGPDLLLTATVSR